MLSISSLLIVATLTASEEPAREVQTVDHGTRTHVVSLGVAPTIGAGSGLGATMPVAISYDGLFTDHFSVGMGVTAASATNSGLALGGGTGVVLGVEPSLAWHLNANEMSGFSLRGVLGLSAAFDSSVSIVAVTPSVAAEYAVTFSNGLLIGGSVGPALRWSRAVVALPGAPETIVSYGLALGTHLRLGYAF